MRPLEVRRLGVISYADGLRMQRALVEERRADRIPDVLLLLEHPAVITLGVKRDGGRSNIVELYISYLRKKIDSGREPMIHTLRGAGYVLKPAR